MPITTQLPMFAPFLASTPVVPQLYWNVYSSEQRWKEICQRLGALCQYAEQMNVNIGINADDIAALEKEFETFKDSGFEQYYEQLLDQWLKQNFETIMSQLLGIGIYFGLTSDGYFTAYAPSTWGDVSFDTGAVYGSENYGRLMLRYDVANGQGVIDNTDYDMQALSRIVRDALADAAGDNVNWDASTNTLNVPTADTITAGVVKISHEISNNSTDGIAASPDAVYAFAQPRN